VIKRAEKIFKKLFHVKRKMSSADFAGLKKKLLQR